MKEFTKLAISCLLGGSIVFGLFIFTKKKPHTDEKAAKEEAQFQRYMIFRTHEENAYQPPILLDTATGGTWHLGWLTTYKQKIGSSEIEKPERFCWIPIYTVKDSDTTQKALSNGVKKD